MIFIIVKKIEKHTANVRHKVYDLILLQSIFPIIFSKIVSFLDIFYNVFVAFPFGLSSDFHSRNSCLHSQSEGKQTRRGGARGQLRKKCPRERKWQISWLVSADISLPARFMAPSLSPGRLCLFL